ncbi:hypothetical protein F2P56_026334 [Juglans regia]|uniref:Uncharacterized protein n=1 Tax=Juglans regia TaxID=51240 RepID=A0A833TD21_JUGRE|nr:hypothetical protein F2P56_026334 [Juglans regia]
MYFLRLVFFFPFTGYALLFFFFSLFIFLDSKIKENKISIYRFSVIVSVIRKVPPNELLQPRLQIGCRLVPDLTSSRAYVRVRVRYVSVTRHIHYVPLRLPLQMPLQDAHQCRHRHRRCVSQIVNPVRSSPPLLPARPGALPGRVQRSQTTLHDIVNVSEVSGQVHPVLATVYSNRFSLKNIPRKREVSHIGSPPRSVHREKPQSGDGEAVNVVVSMGDFLARFLRGSVETRWSVCSIRLRERHLLVESIHGARGGPDDRWLGIRRLARLEKRNEPRDVAVDVGLWVFHGVPYTGLSR